MTGWHHKNFLGFFRGRGLIGVDSTDRLTRYHALGG